MEDRNRVYRIRTTVGDDAPNVIQVPLNQTYDMFEILSLKLNQTNSYKTYESSYGVIVGRVIANGGFGIENAKISVFIPVSDDDSLKDKLLYNFTSVNGRDDKGIRYNLLPDYVDDACHQNVGTFPNKRLVLDNDDIIEMFDKYWKYTTRTNHSGDYMLFGIPTGSAQIHCDVDLSDCGILSQRPRDMINKGYNATMFESPNKFKSSTNLNSLAQIVSQDKGVYVYPYWGDISDGDDKFGITRCDINIEYKFESYAVFIGSIITDKGSNAIGKNCTGTENNGKMSDLIAGEGTIEMIRKTLDGKVEEFPIMGNRLIDSDGVWCYAIPMNLDYVTTDEFGNLIPTDNPDKGIATRTRARFRISLDENPNDATARKRARYLVPNNPRMGEGEFDETLEADYEFGSATREESYCDMFWNKVYTVKNYIPKLQKNSKETNRKHTGIKLINHYGDNNPMPYNALTIKLSFTYRLICVITKVIISLIAFLNNIISIIGFLPCWLGKLCFLGLCPFKFMLKLIPGCIELSSDFCDDGINPNVYYPGCGKPFSCVWTNKTRKECQNAQRKLPKEDQKICLNSRHQLDTCIENELVQQNDATSFNFNNDWVNGVLYAPLWYRKITPKKRFFFGLIKRKAKDEWCSADRHFDGLRLIQGCAVARTGTGDSYENFERNRDITPYYVKDGKCDNTCQKSLSFLKGMNGLIRTKETMLGQTVYYYRSVEYDTSLSKNIYNVNTNKKGEIKILFATDIVLLGSLNECDTNGIPQFFKSLEGTTYNMPTDILFSDYEMENKFDANGNFIETEYTVSSEMAGCDWGNKNEYGEYDGGLFYDIGCSTIHLMTKSCVNLSRLCEYGVSLDETKQVPKLSDLEDDGDNAFEDLITDGFVSFDELYNLDERSMFATMNGNKLRTKLNVKNGLQEYDFRYLYPHNFDGSLKQTMEDTTKKYNSNVTYRNNYKLEQLSNDYYIFRMGNAPYYYDKDKKFPRYENSFYFYFGLKAGKTAIEKFNSKYFAECYNSNDTQSQIGIRTMANGWCGEKDGYVAFDFSNIFTPYNMLINGITNNDITYDIKDINFNKIIIYDTDENVSQFEDYEHLKNGDEFVKMLENGSYKGIVTDSNGSITEFTFSIVEKYLSFKTEIQDFEQPNNVLGTDYTAICNRVENLQKNDETKQVTREIGGVITIYDINMNNNNINYRVRVEPKKKIEGYEFVEFTNSDPRGLGVHTYTTANKDVIYGICVPKGGISYNIIINELCNGVDTKNVVRRTVFISEPMPFKMFINEVDYDLIKNFNKIDGTEEYSNGWKPKNKIKNKKADLQDKNNRTITFTNNPWFNINNVWADSTFKNISSIKTIDEEITEANITKFINLVYNGTYQFNTDIEGKTVSLNQLLNEFTRISVGGNPKVYYTWNGDYIVNDYHSGSFKPTVDKYNLENINDLVNDLNSFVEEVNNVIILRNNLPSLMQEAFYLTCSNDQKNINIRVQTSDMPAVVTLVYQQETAVEESNENTLTSNDMTISYEGNIDNINIPTITYACNEKYGIKDSLTYEPVVAEVVKGKKKYQKHAYYVGTMNDTQKSIPVKLKASNKNNGIWQIDEDNNLNALFDFPIIDKVLQINYISWSYMDKIPYFKKYDIDGNLIKETVTMNGVFAANIFNGNISINNEFDTQSLCGLTLNLSNNLMNSQQTYVEKRIVLGYKNDDSLQGLYSFDSYIVDKKVIDDTTQYAPVLPLQTTLLLEGEDGCGISETIFGNMRIELTDESVNNCITKDKILEVIANNADNGDVIYYSVINANNTTYPLNYANNELLLSQINNTVEGLYGLGHEYNIFSYKMTSDYFREGTNKIVDSSLKSQLEETQDNGSVTYVDKYGYGTTGKFTGTINQPIYIVAETTNHCRALSPVYDYSNVVANVKYGTLERGEVKETEKEDGTKEYNIEVVKDYKFGISINGNETEQFYLLNYDYKLSGFCKLDSVNNIEIKEETLSVPNQYIFTTITENLYNIIKSKYASNNSFIQAILLKTFKNNMEIIAYDYTGLKHICDIKNPPFETTWYSYIWNVNVPEGVSKAGIKVNENEFSIYEEDYYEKGTPLNEVTIYTPISEEDNIRWRGWSENIPFEEGGIIINEADWSSIIGTNGIQSCKVFYGNWKDRETLSVRFFESNGITQIGDTVSVAYDATVTPPDGYIGKTWYVKGDITKTAVDFSTYKIQKDTDFVLREATSTTTISIPWRFENNRSGGDSVQTMKTTFTNGYYFSSGGGIQPHGGNRTGKMEVPESMQTVPFVVESVEVVPNYTEPTAYKIIQTPNPYYYNGDTTTLLVSIEDA